MPMARVNANSRDGMHPLRVVSTLSGAAGAFLIALLPEAALDLAKPANLSTGGPLSKARLRPYYACGSPWEGRPYDVVEPTVRTKHIRQTCRSARSFAV